MRVDSYRLVLALYVASIAPQALAGTDTAQSHGAHVHGIASLTFALEQQQAELMLESPLVNLTGFEHAPRSAAEQAQWDKTRSLLQSGQWLQLPAAAQCRLVSHQLDQPWDSTGHSHAGDSDVGHDHAGDSDAGHADVQLSLSYRCAVPQALTQVAVDLFRHAADLQQIDVQWAGMQQGAATLTPAAAKFQLSQD